MYLMLLLLVRDDRRPKTYTNKRQSCIRLRKHNNINATIGVECEREDPEMMSESGLRGRNW